jgi:hypothetical protein
MGNHRNRLENLERSFAPRPSISDTDTARTHLAARAELTDTDLAAIQAAGCLAAEFVDGSGGVVAHVAAGTLRHILLSSADMAL